MFTSNLFWSEKRRGSLVEAEFFFDFEGFFGGSFFWRFVLINKESKANFRSGLMFTSS